MKQSETGLTPEQQARLDEKNRQLEKWLAQCNPTPEVASQIHNLQASYANKGWGIEMREKDGRLVVAFTNCTGSSNRPTASAFLDEL